MVALIEPVIPALRRYAFALLRDGPAADDLVQDALERAITRWHQRRTEGSTRSWIFAIVHNLAINHLRRAARQGSHMPLDALPESAVSQPPAQEQALQHRDLLAAVAELPDEQQGVLLLVSVEGLSYAEAAQVLAIPIGTVMSRLSRGRAGLQRLMESGVGRNGGAESSLRRVK